MGSRNNERLEFLGDAVLDLIVAEMLFAAHPGLAEGEMAKTRAAVVGEPVLADIATSIGVGDAIVLGVGEEQTGGRSKPSILSDAIEALIGAVYLESGFERVATLVRALWSPLVAERVEHPGKFDFKSRLQEAVAASGRGRPEYRAEMQGPDHAKLFTVIVMVDGAALGTGTGTSKKRAEQEAAREALDALDGA